LGPGQLGRSDQERGVIFRIQKKIRRGGFFFVQSRPSHAPTGYTGYALQSPLLRALDLKATPAILNGDNCRKEPFMKTASARDVMAGAPHPSPVRSPSTHAEHPTLPSTVDLLGGEAVIKRRIDSKIDVHELILTGLPNVSVTYLIERIPELKDELFFQKAIGMSLRTFQRKTASNRSLTSEQSGKTWNFAEVIAQATSVFGTTAAALEWLSNPAMALEGKVPLDLLDTSAGLEMVRDLLGRFEYGVYT
jgi:putative toxin-antitoxin system antitoxin component (TIGR02293 family)